MSNSEAFKDALCYVRTAAIFANNVITLRDGRVVRLGHEGTCLLVKNPDIGNVDVVTEDSAIRSTLDEIAASFMHVKVVQRDRAATAPWGAYIESLVQSLDSDDLVDCVRACMYSKELEQELRNRLVRE